MGDINIQGGHFGHFRQQSSSFGQVALLYLAMINELTRTTTA
jgi:hypothetical protein